MDTNNNTKNAVIILAAGNGTRAKNNEKDELPKQFNELKGESVLECTAKMFVKHDSIDIVQVVIQEQHKELYEKCSENLRGNDKLVKYAIGGDTRQESGLEGLKALVEYEPENVLIHDAARPFVSGELIGNVIDGLKQYDAVVPCVEMDDALKKIDEKGYIAQTLNRNEHARAQTPQGFKFRKILEAHLKAQKENINDFHDDAEIAMWNNMKVYSIKGEKNNLKITKPEDFEI